jgi:hypothetical protein
MPHPEMADSTSDSRGKHLLYLLIIINISGILPPIGHRNLYKRQEQKRIDKTPNAKSELYFELTYTNF